jgi:hypothetical protein
MSMTKFALIDEGIQKPQPWAVLQAWFYKNHRSLPEEVSEAIDTLLDRRQSED